MNRRQIRRCLGLVAVAAAAITILAGCDDMEGKYKGNPLKSDWWVKARCEDTVIKTNKDITALNASIFATEGIGMVRPDKMGNVTETAVREMIEEASFPSKDYLNGKPITDAERNRIVNNRNLGDAEPSEPTDTEDLGQLIHLEKYVTVRYAIATENADVRTYPTGDRLSNDTGRHDYLQETGLYLGEPMAILWTSLDGNWFFAQAGNYHGWVAKTAIGFCDEDFFKKYCEFYFEGKTIDISGNTGLVRGVDINCREFKVKTPSGYFSSNIVDGPLSTGISDSYMQYVRMGTILPMGEYLFFPKRTSTGDCTFIASSLDKKDFITVGSLEFTTANIIIQAGKLLGTPYSWGDENEQGTDCSSTVNSVYRCFGLFLPRNTGDQKKMPLETVDLSDMDSAAKIERISALSPGTLLYMPGHVMMLLGDHQGSLFILHNTTTVNSDSGATDAYACIITPIEAGATGATYLDRIDKAVLITK